MLTRLEVTGFKNLVGLEVEFGPFTCIAGENGTGKSNVFDAIQFLGLLADASLADASRAVRGVADDQAGDPRELFWNGRAEGEHRMDFAAEMLVPPLVEDDFGRPALPTVTFLRYELSLGYRPPRGTDKLGRLTLLAESLRPVPATVDLAFPHSHAFRDAVRDGGGSGDASAFISTTSNADGQRIVSIHPDGPGRGQAKPAAASRAPATVVATVASNDDPTILAARREMQSWRRIALEPSALRSPDRYGDPPALASDGRHLPAALHRVANLLHPEDPSRTYARVAGRLADLSGLAVGTLEVAEDDVRELFTVHLREIGGLDLPARSLSEGTLRFLALCVLLEDPDVHGLLCMEEPENGIHPANLPAMADLLGSLAVDPHEAPGLDNPLRQVLINTHSPGVVQLVRPEDLLFADTAAFRTPDGRLARRLRLRPLADTWRAARSGGDYVSTADILPFLTPPPQANISVGWGDL